MASMWTELKRRNVVRVAIAYSIVAWLALQIADTVTQILDLPNWISQAVLLLLGVGFVIAVIVAWAYELTPEGIKRERDVDRSESITDLTGRKVDFIIIGVLVVALGFFAFDRFVWRAQEAGLDKSIAVIPFANRSADETDANFVDGIHDDILTQLANLSGIDKVISRTSVEQYRDTEKTVPEIAAELGVATILEGGVQRAGGSIRINVQLISADDQHLWAENYDRELTIENMFAIQSEIATTIANEMSAALTEEDEEDLAKQPTDSLEAWEKYQLGRHLMRDRTYASLTQAREYLEEAVEIDEGFALAHVNLADTIIHQVSYGWEEGEDITPDDYMKAMAEARVVAQRALAIDPRLGEAYTTIGYTYFQSSTREDQLQADFYYRKAIELSPNYNKLNRWYPQTLWLHPLNQPAYALTLAERAVALDPLNSTSLTALGLAYEMNGRTDDAARIFDRAIELSSTNMYAVREKIAYLRRQGEYSRAIVTGQDALARLPDSAVILGEITHAYRLLGDTSLYEFWSGRLVEFGVSFFIDLVGGRTALNERRPVAAIQHLEAALEEWPGRWDIIHPLAHAYAMNGQPEQLLDFIGTQAPEMLNREEPAVPPQGAMLVAAAAWALDETGDAAQADKLVELGLEIARTGPRYSDFGYGVEIGDIEMHAVQGNYRFALDALAQAVDNGYRNPEWLESSHFLDPIRSEPEFIAAMEVIREELARQRSELEEMERNGDLAPLPQ